MVRDLDDSVNQSLFLSIFLKSISILFKLLPLVKNSLSMIVFNLSQKDIKLETIVDNEFLVKGKDINKIDILFKKIDKNND